MHTEGREIKSCSDPLYAFSVARLQAAKRDLCNERPMHTCSTTICNPQSEAQLISERRLLGPPATSNVFLCRYGYIHVCSQDACTYYTHTNNMTCPISSMQHGQIIQVYDANDYRTWRCKPEAMVGGGGGGAHSALEGGPSAGGLSAGGPSAAGKTHRELSNEEIRTRASAIVKLLLYSNARINRNRAAIESSAEAAETARATYVRNQRLDRQLPFWTDSYRAMAHYTSRPLPLTIFEFNQALHDYYVEIVRQTWHRVMRYYNPHHHHHHHHNARVGAVAVVGPPRVEFNKVCLGVLYIMRQGLSFGNLWILPKDDFLLINLPIVNELRYFGIDKSCITDGDAIVTVAFETALTQMQVAHHELQIDETTLPEKSDPDGQRPQADESGRIFKMGSNGERLFMLKSRKDKGNDDDNNHEKKRRLE